MTTITTASQAATSVVVVSEKGGQGLPGADGADGSGFNQVRKSKIDNPLCHLFKTNKLVEASAPTGTDADVTWTRSTTATYVDRYGTVKTAAINTPREEKEGFLIEGAATNIALYSKEIDNASYIKVGGSVSANSTEAPDGSLTADLFTEDTSTGTHRIQQTVSLDLGENYTCSLFAKPNGRSSYQVRTGSGASATFDVSTGITTGITTGALLATIQPAANGFFLLTFGFVAEKSVESLQVRIISGGTSYTGEGVSGMYVTDFQIEKGYTSTSRISTSASPFTRTADIVSVPMLNNMPLLHSDFSITGSFRTDNTSGSRIMDTSGSNDRPVIKHNGANKIFAFGTTGSVNVAIITATSGVDFAFTYNSTGSTGRIYANGLSNTATLDFNSALASSPDNIRLASPAIDIFYGHLKDFRLYDFELNADEVEYLA